MLKSSFSKKNNMKELSGNQGVSPPNKIPNMDYKTC